MALILILLTTVNLTWIPRNRDWAFPDNGPRHSEYQNALDSSLANSKPVLLHFTADNCPNPIKMKELLRSDSTTRELLSNFIYLELSVTDKTPLKLQETYENELGIAIKTKGTRNADLEMTVHHENVQPYLVIVNGLEEIITTSKFIPTSEDLRKFLLSGMRK